MLQPRSSKYALQMEGGQRIILTDLGANRWQVQLWGPATMQVNFVGLTTREAKEHAVAIVSLHLLERRPGIQVPTSREWRPVLSRAGGQISRGLAAMRA